MGATLKSARINVGELWLKYFSLGGEVGAPEGTNGPSLSSYSLPKPGASMKPVSTETPAWEISDWPVKLTGRDGKTKVDFCIEKVLPRSANNGLDNHYFPSSEHLFPD